MTLAIAADLDYEVLMLDVQTAFPNANVEEEVYVKMVPGYETYDRSGRDETQEESLRSSTKPQELVRHHGRSSL